MVDKKEVSADKELAKQLVGKTVVLSPSVAFFVEDNGQYVLNAYDSNSSGAEFEHKASKVVIKEGWKLEPTLRNVRAGILRVFNEKDEDITVQFGGPAVALDRKSRPLVTDSIPRMDPEDKRDVKLLKVLSNINEDEILKDIVKSGAGFEVLERLLQLELAGENPAFRSRMKVVDGITELIKNTSGITSAGKIDNEAEEKVTTVRK